MKNFIVSIAFSILSFAACAQVVTVDMKNTEIKSGQKIEFDVVCASEQDLEITVFSNDCLIAQQKSTLIPGNHPFSFSEYSCRSGKFFVLVTGNGIHVEKEFRIME